MTVKGSGFAGGDSYQCRFGGALLSSPWVMRQQNEVGAIFEDEETLLCTSPKASDGLATRIFYEDFNDASREQLANVILANNASIESGRLNLTYGASKPKGSASFGVIPPAPSFEAFFSLAMQDGYVEFLYAALPFEAGSINCVPRCIDDPHCPPYFECAPTPKPASNGLRVRFDASAQQHALQIDLHQTTVVRRGLLTNLTANSTQPANVAVAVRDSILTVSFRGEEILSSFPLSEWVETFDSTWRVGVSAATAAARKGGPLLGRASVDDFELRDATTSGSIRTAVSAFSAAVNAQQFSADKYAFAFS